MYEWVDRLRTGRLMGGWMYEWVDGWITYGYN